MRHLLIFGICLIAVSGYCLSVSAQEAAQPAKSEAQAAPAKKKKEFEDFSKVTEDSKSYQGFFQAIREKRKSLLRNSTLTIRPTFSMYDESFTRVG